MANLTNPLQITMNDHVERAKILGVETIRLSDLQRRFGLTGATFEQLESVAKVLKKRKLIKDYAEGVIFVS